VTLTDASKNMVEQVSRKIAEMQISNAKAICIDLMEQIRHELTADYIILVQTLLHIKETEIILSRLFDMLKSGGHLLIVDYNKNKLVVSDEVHNGFEQEKLVNTVKEIGFDTANSKTFYKGKDLFMNKDASLFILDATKI
jgi:2-polyprenyl-3-methyl-5-hydroxy-6-metoxy-1,4-benzoquinol methylase